MTPGYFEFDSLFLFLSFLRLYNTWYHTLFINIDDNISPSLRKIQEKWIGSTSQKPLILFKQVQLLKWKYRNERAFWMENL